MEKYQNKYPEARIVGESRKPIQWLARGMVRRYDSYDPRLAIDIPSGVVVFDNLNPFESHSFSDLDKVEFKREGQDPVVLFTVGNSDIFNGEMRHEVHSPECHIGFAFGDHLEYAFAARLYPTRTIRGKAIFGQGRFDESVERYIEEQVDLPKFYK